MRRFWKFIDNSYHNYSEWLFYAALIVFLLSPNWFYISDRPEWVTTLSSYANKFAIRLCLFRLLLMSHRYPWYVACSFIAIILANISCHFAANNLLYNTTVLILVSRDIDFRSTLRTFLIAFLIIVIINCPLYLTGISCDIVKHKFGLVGHSWGFCNPNWLAFLLVISTFGVLTYYGIQQRRVISIACMALASVTIWVTLSASSAIILLLLPVVYLLVRQWQPSARSIVLLPTCFLGISILLAYWYGPSFGTDTFNCRFSIPALVWQDWGLSLMGQNCLSPIDLTAGAQNNLIILDNLFLRIPLLYGFIPSLIAYFLWSRSFWLIAKSHQLLLLSIAISITVYGFMEQLPLAILNPTLFYACQTNNYSPLLWRRVFYALCGLVVVFLVGVYNPFLSTYCNNTRPMISDISPLDGFCREDNGKASDFSTYLRQLPLADNEVPITLFEGQMADSLERFCYRVVDVPLLAEAEQCADVCLHLRADYLYHQRRFSDIHFEDTQHHIMQHKWYGLRSRFEEYLRTVFNWANTESMKNEMPTRNLEEIQVGDVWIYDAKSRSDARYGHAIMVADVTKNAETGEIALLLVQGSTPACSIHVLNNTIDPACSPWFILDQKADTIDFGMAKYHRSELHYFKD